MDAAFHVQGFDLSVDGDAFKAAHQLENALTDKFAGIRGDLEKRRAALVAAAVFLISALDREIATMHDEAERLRVAVEALENHARKNAELKAEADRRTAYRDAAAQDVSDAEDRLAELDADIRDTNRSIQTLDNRISGLQAQLYNWDTRYTCPAGANYQTCTAHPGWRRQLEIDVAKWDRDRRSAEQERADVRARRGQQQRSRQQINDIELPALRRQWQSLAEAASQAEDVYRLDKVALDTEREAAWKEIWTSRVDEHTRASESQKQRTTDLQGKLNVALPVA